MFRVLFILSVLPSCWLRPLRTVNCRLIVQSSNVLNKHVATPLRGSITAMASLGITRLMIRAWQCTAEWSDASSAQASRWRRHQSFRQAEKVPLAVKICLLPSGRVMTTSPPSPVPPTPLPPLPECAVSKSASPGLTAASEAASVTCRATAAIRCLYRIDFT